MENILVLNGHEYYPHSKGRLNDELFQTIVEMLRPQLCVKTSVLQERFDVKDEQEKVLWADTIIYQTPVYNYSVPALFKKYIDMTHEYGVYFSGNAEAYGIGGGKLTDKKYMLSTTWNAPAHAFENPDLFFEGKSVDDILFHIHLSHKYAGLIPLETFACFDVKKNPDVTGYINNLRMHLKEQLNLN
ncbi:NAD(P)H-dependent oxidoreductase [Halobacillus litoralis]|uniref:Flavodoxin n=1 Tax=Halobacillus litoralis TaxID=45668 RepID=A0A410MD12_9BACI|nr:NAD(P)H-dependent oxidoreductase [Halobacillus litoralis]QAS52609.1 flavodoxin [Halobacillus litoralis]